MKIKIQEQWQAIPGFIRKPVAFILGFFFIILAGLTGWLPGPGGIPLFLIGIAILATEFTWAKKIRDLVLDGLRWCQRWYRQHRQLGMILLTLIALIGAVALYIMIRMTFHI
ncbi:hypothetical protein EYC58_01515 [Candidatus Saccharibacteria bacterium]|nr:MAG: hypothetical protein EYC58_01515 [Candidatus Saccharibacteria bacterium]